MRSALIHRARRLGYRAGGARSAQGQYDPQPDEGPSFAARFMERNVSARQRRGDQSARQARTYELLADFLDVDGGPVELESGMQLLVVAPPVTPADGWIVQVNGDPERLNNGVEMIGWMANATKVGDAP